MTTRYIKRYRMEIDLKNRPLFSEQLPLPTPYQWVAWAPNLAKKHAEAKYNSFQGELDATVFPCLGKLSGCTQLMMDISTRTTFLPEATWLVQKMDDSASENQNEPEPCGTIQGVGYSPAMGAIQNVGIVAKHRGKGLGRALVEKAIIGFQAAEIARVFLEVTAENHPAVKLYQSIGFRIVHTMFKSIELENTTQTTMQSHTI